MPEVPSVMRVRVQLRLILDGTRAGSRGPVHANYVCLRRGQSARDVVVQGEDLKTRWFAPTQRLDDCAG